MSPAASWGLLLALIALVVAVVSTMAWRDHHRPTVCRGCGARPHRPRSTGRMWGDPHADEPSSIEWCTGRRLVNLPLGYHLDRRGRERQDPRPAALGPIVWPDDDEPF